MLDSLLNPKNIAIIGVSNNPTKLSTLIYFNVLRGGFGGKVYPVNPNYTEIFGAKCYAEISEITEEIDIACIAVPAEKVKDILIECGVKKVQNAIIITAGFSEMGESGTKLEKELEEIAQIYGINILGPNCLGEIITGKNLNLSFAQAMPKSGTIAFASQSGAVCSSIIDLSINQSVGFSHIISLGNKLGINENILLSDFLEDSNVDVVGMYLEDFYNFRTLSKIYTESKVKKPFAVIKPGKTQKAKEAISSHTGSIAGDAIVASTALKAHNIVECDNIEELLHVLKYFAWGKKVKGRNVCVISNAGGAGILAVDSMVKAGMNIATMQEFTKSQLRSVLPPNASVKNPIDVVGDATAERYSRALELALNDKNVDIVILILTPQVITQVEETARIVGQYYLSTDKPIVPIFVGDISVASPLERLETDRIPAFRSIDDAVNTLKKVIPWWEYNWENQKTFKNILENKQEDSKSKINLINDDVKVAGNFQLEDETIIKLAKDYDLPLPPQKIISTIDEALEFATDNYPVVLKLPSSKSAHRTELKGVRLNIDTPEKLERELADLKSVVDKVLIQKQLRPKTELFLGVKRDGNKEVYKELGGKNGIGHLFVFGTGGVYAELYNDFGFTVLPASRDDIKSMIEGTKVFQILNGFRGTEKFNVERIVDLIEKIQKLVLTYPEIVSLDINPLCITQTNELVVLDMKVSVY